MTESSGLCFSIIANLHGLVRKTQGPLYILLKKILGVIQGFSDPALGMIDVFLRNTISYYDNVKM